MALPVIEALSADAAVDAAPRGAGYLSLAIGNKGVVKVVGILADGTRVSRSVPLLTDGTSAAVTLLAPLYAKKGSLAGVLSLDMTSGIITAAADRALLWHNPGRRGIDGFTELLAPQGGYFDLSAVIAAAPLFMSAELEATSWYAGGEVYNWVGGVEQVPLNANGARLLAVKGAKPKKVSDRESGTVWYEYDEVNPIVATFSLAARSGVFKGKFTLWCDYEDAKGKLIHKGVKASYGGVMVPATGLMSAGQAMGLGHCLVPEANPEYKALRLKRSRLLRIER